MNKATFFLQKINIINIVSILISIIIVISVIRIGFWELNIFKKEASINQELKELENELNLLEQTNFKEKFDNLTKNLPPRQKILISPLSTSSIGKNNWFE